MAMFSRIVLQTAGNLRNDADLLAHAARVHLADVVPIDQDPTFVRFVKTRQQLHQGALATAALADDADKAAAGDLQINPVDVMRSLLAEAESRFSIFTWPEIGGRDLICILFAGLWYLIDDVGQTFHQDAYLLGLPETGEAQDWTGHVNDSEGDRFGPSSALRSPLGRPQPDDRQKAQLVEEVAHLGGTAPQHHTLETFGDLA